MRLQEFLIGGGGGGGGAGVHTRLFQVLNVSYSGSSMVYFGPTFSRGVGGGWERVV